jgi:hypothetical protein
MKNMENEEKLKTSGAFEYLYDDDDYLKLRCTIEKREYPLRQVIFKTRKEKKYE